MIGMKIRKLFFDRKAVARQTDRATGRVLSRFGGYVRKVARRSIVTRKRARVSRPGKPPLSQTGLLRRGIVYYYDRTRQNVTIGPSRLNQKIGDAPHALEYGGTSTVATGRRGKRKLRRVKVAARPYMRPAFERSMPALPGMWKDSIRKAY